MPLNSRYNGMPSTAQKISDLKRQLAAANERAGRMEAQMEELRVAWNTPISDDGEVRWNVFPRHAYLTITRILGGA